jgi:pimeloyl-ACP methyl ester carboxylesterase
VARVVAVHGILNQYGSRRGMHSLWVPSLIGGVESATQCRDILADEDVECAFYGDVFRPSGRRLSVTSPVYTADDIDHPYERELLQTWWEAAAVADPGVVGPAERTLSARRQVQRALLALARSRLLSGLAESSLIFLLKQVRVYFTDVGVRSRIHERFAAAVMDDTRVVVAHSLGSVVAYEGIHAHPEWSIRGLVTLGSPLGVPNLVFDRLCPKPEPGPPKIGLRLPAIQRWTNVADSSDFVALRKKLDPLFANDIQDFEIDNGVTAHSAVRYLTAPETGAGIAAILQRP